jgi:hypothetical protein
MVEDGGMAHGGADDTLSPRDDTKHWAAAGTVGCALLAVILRDTTYLFTGAMCFALLLQCAQRIQIDGRFVQRVGLRPVTLDLSTAVVVHEGTSWWRELFLCGRVLQLRDDDGHRLYLESWLWDASTRDLLVERAAPVLSR